MNTHNGIIVVDVGNVDRDLKRIGAVQNQVASYLIVGVPSWANSVKMTIFNEYEEGFPEIVGSKVTGTTDQWEITTQDYVFPNVGDVRYELNAYVGIGTSAVQRPLGCGKIRIMKYYGSTFEPAPHPETVVANAIRDKDGGVHPIVAENVGTAQDPDWSANVGDRVNVTVGVNVLETIPDSESKDHEIKAKNVGTEQDPDWSIEVKGENE